MLSFLKTRKAFLLWEFSCKIILIFFYGLFAYRFSVSFLETHSISTLLYLIYELIIISMIAMRTLPSIVSTSVFDWIIAFVGTLAPLMMRPIAGSDDDIVFVCLQIAGIIISMIGLISLNKSIGMVAANRGIKVSGLYGLVRHPLYAGYFLSIGAFLIQNFSLLNISIFVVFAVAQILRVFAEEKVLIKDPEYEEYTKRVKWRIIPYIW